MVKWCPLWRETYCIMGNLIHRGEYIALWETCCVVGNILHCALWEIISLWETYSCLKPYFRALTAHREHAVWSAHGCMLRRYKLPEFISRQLSRQEMCPVTATRSQTQIPQVKSFCVNLVLKHLARHLVF